MIGRDALCGCIPGLVDVLVKAPKEAGPSADLDKLLLEAAIDFARKVR